MFLLDIWELHGWVDMNKPSGILTFTSYNGKSHIQLFEEYYKEIDKIRKEAVKEYLYRKAADGAK